MTKRLKLLALVLAVCCPALPVFASGLEKVNPHLPIRIEVSSQILNPVDERLFGQFLERASFGEPGPEIALRPGKRQLPTQVVKMMQQMNIPILRFPGGMDADYIDWRDMVSNVPGRSPERPLTRIRHNQEITNYFGLDEYFLLRNRLQSETIFVVNFLDAVARQLPLPKAASNAAGVIAYTNAPLGTELPRGMPNWPAVRAENGHPQPYGVEYVQIGNEWWSPEFLRQVQQGTGLSNTPALAQWYLRCLKAYIEEIRAVDSHIGIIIEGDMGKGIENMVLTDSYLRQNVKYVTFHTYAPGPMNQVFRNGKPYPAKQMTATDWWNAWVAMPGEFSSAGENIALGKRGAMAAALGYQLAVTEWNWNGWGWGEVKPRPDLQWSLAAGLGTAGFLHGLMRVGNTVKIATQSVLVGAYWDITSIRVDPQGQQAPYFFPQGQVTRFYRQHHGQQVLKTNISGIPSYLQPLRLGWGAPQSRVLYVDVVVTADKKRLFIHAINRHLEQSFPASLDFSDFGAVAEVAEHHILTGRLRPIPGQRPHDAIELLQRNLSVSGTKLDVELPPHSASIIEISFQD